MTAGRLLRARALPPGPGVPAWADFGKQTATSALPPLRPSPSDWRDFGKQATESTDAESDDKATVVAEVLPTGNKPPNERQPRADE